jgi:hypothetical protein
MILGPKAKCAGLDMNRSVVSLFVAYLVSTACSARNWVRNKKSIVYSIESSSRQNRQQGYKWKPRVQATDTSADPLRPKERTDPCSPWYPGHRPFEAPEVNNIANYISTLPKLIAFVDLRSYGQMCTLNYSYFYFTMKKKKPLFEVSSPFSYSCTRMPQAAEDQTEAALGATFALRMEHGTVFNVRGKNPVYHL